jgi:hypothetical protein
MRCLLTCLLLTACTPCPPPPSICLRVLRARCVATQTRVRCALEAHDFSRLDLTWLDVPVMDGDMVCGHWRAP